MTEISFVMASQPDLTSEISFDAARNTLDMAVLRMSAALHEKSGSVRCFLALYDAYMAKSDESFEGFREFLPMMLSAVTDGKPPSVGSDVNPLPPSLGSTTYAETLRALHRGLRDVVLNNPKSPEVVAVTDAFEAFFAARSAKEETTRNLFSHLLATAALEARKNAAATPKATTTSEKR